jgi:hypothetical protein
MPFLDPDRPLTRPPNYRCTPTFRAKDPRVKDMVVQGLARLAGANRSTNKAMGLAEKRTKNKDFAPLMLAQMTRKAGLGGEGDRP